MSTHVPQHPPQYPSCPSTRPLPSAHFPAPHPHAPLHYFMSHSDPLHIPQCPSTAHSIPLHAPLHLSVPHTMLLHAHYLSIPLCCPLLLYIPSVPSNAPMPLCPFMTSPVPLYAPLHSLHNPSPYALLCALLCPCTFLCPPLHPYDPSMPLYPYASLRASQPFHVLRALMFYNRER